MKKNLRYVYWSLLILCGGFAVLEYFEGNRMNAALWLAGFALIMILWSLLFRTPEKKDLSRQLDSLLEPETRKAMDEGHFLNKKVDGVHWHTDEKVLWYDNAANDYYDGKKGVMYLSNQRILFLSKDFTFSHPIDRIELKPTKHGIELKINKHSMRFLTASTPELLLAWDQLRTNPDTK